MKRVADPAWLHESDSPENLDPPIRPAKGNGRTQTLDQTQKPVGAPQVHSRIADLPNETLRAIFGHLPARAMVQASQTSTAWSSACTALLERKRIRAAMRFDGNQGSAILLARARQHCEDIDALQAIDCAAGQGLKRHLLKVLHDAADRREHTWHLDGPHDKSGDADVYAKLMEVKAAIGATSWHDDPDLFVELVMLFAPYPASRCHDLLTQEFFTLDPAVRIAALIRLVLLRQTEGSAILVSRWLQALSSNGKNGLILAERAIDYLLGLSPTQRLTLQSCGLLKASTEQFKHHLNPGPFLRAYLRLTSCQADVPAEGRIIMPLLDVFVQWLRQHPATVQTLLPCMDDMVACAQRLDQQNQQDFLFALHASCSIFVDEEIHRYSLEELSRQQVATTEEIARLQTLKSLLDSGHADFPSSSPATRLDALLRLLGEQHDDCRLTRKCLETFHALAADLPAEQRFQFWSGIGYQRVQEFKQRDLDETVQTLFTIYASFEENWHARLLVKAIDYFVIQKQTKHEHDYCQAFESAQLWAACRYMLPKNRQAILRAMAQRSYDTPGRFVDAGFIEGLLTQIDTLPEDLRAAPLLDMVNARIEKLKRRRVDNNHQGMLLRTHALPAPARAQLEAALQQLEHEHLKAYGFI